MKVLLQHNHSSLFDLGQETTAACAGTQSIYPGSLGSLRLLTQLLLLHLYLLATYSHSCTWVSGNKGYVYVSMRLPAAFPSLD